MGGILEQSFLSYLWGWNVVKPGDLIVETLPSLCTVYTRVRPALRAEGASETKDTIAGDWMVGFLLGEDVKEGPFFPPLATQQVVASPSLNSGVNRRFR